MNGWRTVPGWFVLAREGDRLLELRYIHRMGQRETAAHLGVSQMQVSRMERRILARLRQSEENRQERS